MYVFINHIKWIFRLLYNFMLNVLTKCANFSFDYLQTCFIFCPIIISVYLNVRICAIRILYVQFRIVAMQTQHRRWEVEKKTNAPFFAIIKYPWFETFRCHSLWMSTSTHFYALCFFLFFPLHPTELCVKSVFTKRPSIDGSVWLAMYLCSIW